MKYFSLVCASIIFSFSPLFADAEKPGSGELTKSLITCLEVELTVLSEQLENTSAENDQVAYRMFATKKSEYERALLSVRSLEFQLRTSDISNALQYVSRLQIPQDAAKCIEINTALGEALIREREAEDTFYADIMDRIKKNVGEKLLEADKLSDLDDLFVYVSDFNEKLSKSQFRSKYSSELSNIIRIISQWQEYLAYLGAGDSRKSLSAMSNIVNYSTNTPIVPRSSLLKLKLELEGLSADSNRTARNNNEAPVTVESVVAAFSNIDELLELRKQLIALKDFNDTRNDANNLLGGIYKLERSIHLIQEGNALIAFTVLDDLNTSYNNMQLLERFKSQVAASALSGTIPQKYRELASGLSFVETLNLVAARMRDAEEWILLWELFKVMDLYFKRQGSHIIASLSNDVNAIESFLQGQSLEDSGKLSDALNAYERVIGRTGVYGPYDAAEKAIRNLRELRTAELYADQKKEADTPRAPVIPRDPRMMYGGHSREFDSVNTRLEIESMVNQVIEKKIGLYMAAEKEKETKKVPAPQK